MKKKWYKDKVFVITGASGGIGSEICRTFATLGLRMYLLDLPSQPLEDLVEEVKSLGATHAESMHMNLMNPEEIKKVINSIGEKEQYIDILYNNAGIGNKASILNEGSFEEYRKLMSINVDGMWLVLQTALPYIGRPAPTKKCPERRVGQLIFSSSLAGKTGVPNMAAYSISKHSVIALADSVRMEYRMKYGKNAIQVITTLAAPANTGFYNTGILENWRDDYQNASGLFKFIEAKDVAKRVLKASLKYKKEIAIPRYSWLLSFLNCLSHGYVERLMIKIDKQIK
ncbi:MAG: SDR family NAD(P)-dependent oxidoreductase [Promethearchaeota archaeon]